MWSQTPNSYPRARPAGAGRRPAPPLELTRWPRRSFGGIFADRQKCPQNFYEGPTMSQSTISLDHFHNIHVFPSYSNFQFGSLPKKKKKKKKLGSLIKMSLLLLILLSKFGKYSPLQPAACTALHSWHNTKQLFFVVRCTHTSSSPKKINFFVWAPI